MAVGLAVGCVARTNVSNVWPGRSVQVAIKQESRDLLFLEFVQAE